MALKIFIYAVLVMISTATIYIIMSLTTSKKCSETEFMELLKFGTEVKIIGTEKMGTIVGYHNEKPGYINTYIKSDGQTDWYSREEYEVLK